MKPVLQALVVADRIYEDKATGKKVIAGVFSRMLFQEPSPVSPGESINAPSAGFQAGSPFAYISITDIHDEAKLIVQYVRLDEEVATPIFKTNEISVKCADKLMTVDFAVPLPPFPLIPGVFAVELLCEGAILGAHRIVIEKIK